MAKFKKVVTSFVICVLMVSLLTFDVGAESVTFPVGDATVTAVLIRTSTGVTASAAANKPNVNISISIVGTYYVKGTTTIRTASNGSGGTMASQCTLINGGETWISVKAIFSAAYGGCHNSVTLTV